MKVVKLHEEIHGEWNWECIRRELNVLSRLNHPNIVKLLHFYQTKNKHEFHFILELMSGGTMRDLMRRFKINGWKFNETDLLKFTMDIATGLEYLHARAVIHRDLKPENLLLDASFHVKITDFGIAKFTEDNHDPANHTRVGTLAYMAPEVYLSHLYDRSVDVWAFGVIFAEMTLLEYPLCREEKAKIMNTSVAYKPLQVDFVKLNYSPGAQMIIDASLMRNPRRRWCIADIRRLPIFNLISKPRDNAEQKLMPPPRTSFVVKNRRSTGENKENQPSRRDSTYDAFVKPLVSHQKILSPRPAKALQDVKVQSENTTKKIR